MKCDYSVYGDCPLIAGIFCMGSGHPCYDEKYQLTEEYRIELKLYNDSFDVTHFVST